MRTFRYSSFVFIRLTQARSSYTVSCQSLRCHVTREGPIAYQVYSKQFIAQINTREDAHLWRNAGYVSNS